MSDRPVGVLLEDMLERIDRIARYTQGLDRDAFVQDDKTIDAVVRSLEVIGEAARRLPAEFKARHGEIPWHQIAGLRNRIVHAYFDVEAIADPLAPVERLALQAPPHQPPPQDLPRPEDVPSRAARGRKVSVA